MKTKLNIWFTTVAMAVMPIAFQSCEGILEVDPPINQINTEQIFESVSTADAALSSLYADVQSGSLFSGGIYGAGALLGTYTDDLYCYTTSTQNSELDLYQNIQTASNTRIKGVWSNSYKQVYMANAIIEGINRSNTIPEQDKNRIKGEAMFLRSLIYFYLTQIFGDIPFATTTDYMINQKLYKTPEADVLSKIQLDLQQSIVMMNDTYRNTERIYPNRKTAQLVLAVVMMTGKQWQEAEHLLKEILQSGLYVWQSDLSKTFKMNSLHILWQLKPLKAGNATNEAPLYHFTTSVPQSYSLADNFVNTFAANDLRLQNWMKVITINQHRYYKVDKYKNISNNTDEYSIVFRLEEVYLLLAEALAQQNKLQEALPYLNAVKQKAGITPMPENATKVQILNEILTENSKEFFTERGIRFTTLKRGGRLNDLLTTKLNWKNYHQYWPLPVSELIINPHLNPQNNGY